MKESIPNQSARTYLEKCSSVYEALLARVLKLNRKNDAEKVLQWVQFVAQFCWMAHPGRYADGKLENPAFEIGERLETLIPQTRDFPKPFLQSGGATARRLLHVASTVHTVGGHSRIIKAWADNDRNSIHSLILTNQEAFSVPLWLTEAINARGGGLTIIPETLTLLERALWLKEAANSNKLIVLHIDPDDVLPVVAFADREVPPVAIMNHADHVFWLGSSIADIVIDLRAFGQKLSQERRFAKQSMLLPVPLDLKQPSHTRDEARRRLGVGESEVVLLSIGASYKYKPDVEHDFYDTANKILERNPGARLYLVGVTPDECEADSGKPPHRRAHYLGALEDPSVYQVAADIYLEGFPYGSLMALLETVALNVCPVVMFAPPMPHVDNADSLGGKERVKSTNTQEEYVSYVSSLIEDAEERGRLARETKEYVIARHSPEAWKEQVERIYQQLDSNGHQPAPLPDSEFMATASDLGLSAFSNAYYGDASPLLSLANVNFDKLSRDDLLSLFYASLSSRDTKFSYAPMRNWLGMYKTKMLGV